MSADRDTLHIKISRNNVVYDRNVTLGDIAKMECADEPVVRQLKQMELCTFPASDKEPKLHVFSILAVIELIHLKYPRLTVSNEGEKDFIVEYLPNRYPTKLSERIKTALLCVIIFFGSSFTIMAFNNDVSVTDVFAKLYVQLTGTQSSGVTELEICYSIGLAIGILIFFNHIGRKKITHDPTPIQVEMRKYEKDTDTAFIENAERKGHYREVK